MASTRTAAFVHRLFEIDTAVCQRINRVSRFQTLRTFFAVVSRLGNGVFWYTLIALIVAFDPDQGYIAAVHMLLTALVGHAREVGAAEVLLEVRVDNAPAIHLYESSGFRMLGRRRAYYQPGNIDAWTMRLPLEGA